jgi:hypothetical protein
VYRRILSYTRKCMAHFYFSLTLTLELPQLPHLQPLESFDSNFSTFSEAYSLVIVTSSNSSLKKFWIGVTD